jgi:hypothetical protein
MVKSAKKMDISIDSERGIIRVGDIEMDVNVLLAIANANSRILWRFMSEGGRIHSVPYDESKVIWIENGDLERDEAVV